MTGGSEEYYYLDEFLELEILKELPNKQFLFSEIIYTKPETDVDGEVIEEYYYEAEENILYNSFKIYDQTLKIISLDGGFRPDSHLFFNPELSLKDNRSKEIDILGWKTSHPFSESDLEAFTVGLDLKGISYDTLNVFINNKPMSYDAGGQTHIYSKKYGVIRYAVYSWWHGQGWDRVLDPVKLPF